MLLSLCPPGRRRHAVLLNDSAKTARIAHLRKTEVGFLFSRTEADHKGGVADLDDNLRTALV